MDKKLEGAVFMRYIQSIIIFLSVLLFGVVVVSAAIPSVIDGNIVLSNGAAVNNVMYAESCVMPAAVANVHIPEFGLLGIMLVVLAIVGIVAYIKH